MTQKTHGITQLSESYLVYVKISTCDVLPSRNLLNDMMHAKWMWHALTQGIRTI